MTEISERTKRIIGLLRLPELSRSEIARREGISQSRVYQIDQRYGVRIPRQAPIVPIVSRQEVERSLAELRFGAKGKLYVYELEGANFQPASKLLLKLARERLTKTPA